MIEFTMRVADRVAAVSAMHASTRAFCKAYLCSAEPDFFIRITPEDVAFEREKSMQEDRLEGKAPREFSEAYLETIAVQRKLAEKLFSHDTLLFHGSVVAMDGAAYLFTARSGTGKSTHTRLWCEAFGDRAVMINDDKPFLRMSETGTTAFGSPWMGKHARGCNDSAQLKAICILTRGEENTIVPLEAREAVPMLLQQSNRPVDRSLLPQYMTLLDRLAGSVKFYRLACNMDVRAALTAYEGMKE